ncbi:MAG: glycosyltransferase family 2 protein [Eubacteriales bacterium]|nr:glycosyltransferase family 2 protein [Eubacteriales bacterium]
MVNISVVIPCYNEEAVLPVFREKLEEAAGKIRSASEGGTGFEFIFVDDGSDDGTLDLLKKFTAGDTITRYISFSRNFGKEAAIFAGLEASKGDYIVLMDADLQDPPEMIAEMYSMAATGDYDCVAARRADRKGEPLLRSLLSKLFYRIINRISDVQIVSGARDFRLMSRKYCNAVLKVGEYNRFSKGIFKWVGFKTAWIDYANSERAAGKTKWSFYKLVRYSLEGTMSFSSAPLAAASLIGLLFCLISFILICVIIIKTLVFGDPTSGWPSLACIVFFVGGVQLFCTGIVGEYISRIYLETKKRPLYIINEKSYSSDKLNTDDKN